MATTLATDLRRGLDPSRLLRALDLEPDPWQEELLRLRPQHAWSAAPAESGKSTLASAAACHEAIFKPGSLSLILGPDATPVVRTASQSTGGSRRCLDDRRPEDRRSDRARIRERVTDRRSPAARRPSAGLRRVVDRDRRGGLGRRRPLRRGTADARGLQRTTDRALDPERSTRLVPPRMDDRQRLASDDHDRRRVSTDLIRVSRQGSEVDDGLCLRERVRVRVHRRDRVRLLRG